MDHAENKFFMALRKNGFGTLGTGADPVPRDVMSAIFERGKHLSNPALAYVFATAWHEAKMKPSRESLHYTTPSRIRKVWPSRFPTTKSAEPYVRNKRKLANKVYNGRLGNRDGTNDGWTYRGGGLSHITGRENYRKLTPIVGVDMVAHPEFILDPKIAVEDLISGMESGRYRGHKLRDYFDRGAVQFVNARNIINSDIRANGELVAGYARGFLQALEDAGRPYEPKQLKVAPRPGKRGLWAKLRTILKGKRK